MVCLHQSTVLQISEPTDLASAFTAMKAETAQAVFVLPDLMFAYEAQRIAALALEHRLPTRLVGVPGSLRLAV
jgi:putative ABC transport system substrate-binding protein